MGKENGKESKEFVKRCRTISQCTLFNLSVRAEDISKWEECKCLDQGWIPFGNQDT